MNIYSERYISPIINEMEDILLKYKSFIFYKTNFEKIRNKFSKNNFINSNVLKLICACVFSLKQESIHWLLEIIVSVKIFKLSITWLFQCIYYRKK